MLNTLNLEETSKKELPPHVSRIKSKFLFAAFYECYIVSHLWYVVINCELDFHSQNKKKNYFPRKL